MHTMLNHSLRDLKDLKFSGQDLAIIVGDVLYAIAINAFLAIKEDGKRKEKAFERFIDAAVYTGGGQFIELLYGAENIDKISLEHIYKIYDCKTAHYSFASPLAAGAILGGAKPQQVEKLSQYGLYMGRAFQIKDDIVGLFEDEKYIGKSNLTDLKEAKKTVLIWYAYHHANREGKRTIKKILSKEKVSRSDLKKMREIIITTKALKYAKQSITTLIGKAQKLHESSTMHGTYKNVLDTYTRGLLKITP
jgi:geranylgeranyl diphosphate synthase type I